MPYLGELDSVRALLARGTSILELGAGAGRLTRKLLEWGLSVTAVDNSAAMLAHVPRDAKPVLSDIEKLRLLEAFDTVLLASDLINHPSATSRKSIAATARRHVARGGQLLVERHDPDRLRNAQVGAVSCVNGLRSSIEAVRCCEDDIEMTVRYDMDGRTWRQSFRASLLSEAEIEGLLTEVGFRSFEWFGEKRMWVRAA
ncbi:MAG: class I SAM-dependent methyltransferase [Burkholderiaceae bacterium]|nr:class I SAM-dependent methyltransferase [Burkholderiaceae bacterium]